MILSYKVENKFLNYIQHVYLEIFLIIGIDARMIDDELTGIGRYSYNLLRALGRVDKINNYIIFKNSRCKKSLIFGENFLEFEVPFAKFDFREHFYFLAKIKENNIDVFHSLHYVGPVVGQTKKIITIHDLMALNFPNFFSAYGAFRGYILRTYLKILVSLSLRNVDAVIAVSDQAKQDLIKYHKKVKTKIYTIPEAVDEIFQPNDNTNEKTQLKLKYKLPERFYLYVGNMRPYKNLKRLIDAFILMRDEVETDLNLVIAGSKNDKNFNDIYSYANNKNTLKKIFFPGYIEDSDLPLLISSADCFVFPSLREGFGLPPLEAMACGTPVVASNISSIEGVVKDAGILVNPEDVVELKNAMIEVVANSSLKNEMKVRGLKRSKLFNWNDAAKETLKVYENRFENDLE